MNTQPTEHCGNISPGPLGYRSECVLRPGHSGSHADDQSGRWWAAPARTTPDNPAASNDAADNPLQQQIAAALQRYAAEQGTPDAGVSVLEALGYHVMGVGYSLERAEAAIARVQAAADQLHRAVLNADGVPLTAYDRGVDTAIRRIRAALDEPADGGGPSVREAAADDRRWWGGEKAGE
jgi:hypothetical protein